MIFHTSPNKLVIISSWDLDLTINEKNTLYKENKLSSHDNLHKVKDLKWFTLNPYSNCSQIADIDNETQSKILFLALWILSYSFASFSSSSRFIESFKWWPLKFLERSLLHCWIFASSIHILYLQSMWKFSIFATILNVEKWYINHVLNKSCSSFHYFFYQTLY